MWEESPIGTWTLEVFNDGRSIVELKEWSIAFLGTETPPQPTTISEKIDVPAKVTSAPPAPPPPPPAPTAPPKEILPQRGSSQPVAPPVVDLNNAAPKMPEQNIGDVSGGFSHAAAEKSNPMDNCLEQQKGLDWCNICAKPYLQLNGRCVVACPVEGYYVGPQERNDTCVQCHYTCRTCSAGNDYEVLDPYNTQWKNNTGISP
jgi:hypothetical protein